MGLNVRRQGWDDRRLAIEALEDRRVLAVDFELLKDINTLQPQGSGPNSFVTIGSTTYFIASTEGSGEQLWKTDGTSTGTSLVAANSPTIYSAGLSTRLFKLDEVLYFVADDQLHGYELWRSDGTEAGTFLVKDISPGKQGGSIYNITLSSGRLFFAASDGVHERELWSSDGTEAGTAMVKDIRPGASGEINNLTPVDGGIYFLANDGVNGRELWKSDGTAAGTYLVKDIAPGVARTFSYSVTPLIEVNGRLFFAANDGANGVELWTSLGSEATTHLVKELGGMYGDGDPLSLTNFNGQLYFTAYSEPHGGRELWTSDGTESGTTIVKDIMTTFYSIGSDPTGLTVANGSLYFRANDFSHGIELWKTDGTESGTTMVVDLRPGVDGSAPQILGVRDGLLHFNANDGSGSKRWITDGTTAGTTPFAYPTSPEGEVLGFLFPHAVSGGYLFSATTTAYGSELWRMDADGSNVALVKDINPANGSSDPYNFVIAGTRAIFNATEGLTRNWWITDGTATGTVRFAPYASAGLTEIAGVVASHGRFLFTAKNSSGSFDIWESDGTEAGTQRVANSPTNGFSTRPMVALETEDSLYFGLSQGSHYQLWKSDSNGMAPIPGAISDMGLAKPGPNGSQFFKRYNTLRITDGTEAGTITLKEFGLQNVSISPDAAGDGTSIYFVVDYDQLWKSDGTVAGTQLVRSFDLGNNALSRPIALTVINGTLYFSYITANGNALWKSDGTAEGTTEVFALESGLVANIYNRDDSMFFRTNSGFSGEMWYSDGTAAHTVRLSSLLPPERSPRAYYLDAVKVGDVIYFGANDNVSGDELWSTNLVTGETTLVRDHIAGPIGSRPTTLLKIGQRIVIVARSETHSTELWAMDLPPIAGDYNADGRVDGSDFLAWQRAFGSAASPAGSGADGNNDGIVNGSDLDVWETGYGTGGSAAVTASSDAFALSELTVTSLIASDEMSTITVDKGADDALFGSAADAAFAWLAADRRGKDADDRNDSVTDAKLRGWATRLPQDPSASAAQPAMTRQTKVVDRAGEPLWSLPRKQQRNGNGESTIAGEHEAKLAAFGRAGRHG
ncbi:ELWxxDGT repeat protein [Lacipirellula parvula]|uniref:Uncharacterized protein n=1 Tax=Lacipirellula parvula TaxID=2650471 RepID=A0A5K7XIN6_9BACT|nr:ELWxxDGT repeat protein [Lacipirellula parvula]BBO35887.1 hypothetical protein PLANPX_5499 [Lacipirellula parvula]